FRLPGVTFFCISDTLVPTTYLVDTTLSNASDSDQTVQAVRLRMLFCRRCMFSPYSGLCDASVNLCQKVSARKFTPEKVCRETVLWRNIRKSVRNVIGIVVLRKSIRQKMAGNSLTFTEDKQHHFVIQQENRNPPFASGQGSY
ncbi:hypothetical protein NXZ78_24875, partial [Escherichia coli]|nr:hypothetical protein [Escherichia coli]